MPRFQPGDAWTGNAKGRPKSGASLRELVRKRISPRRRRALLDRLFEIASSSKDERAATNAAMSLFRLGWDLDAPDPAGPVAPLIIELFDHAEIAAERARRQADDDAGDLATRRTLRQPVVDSPHSPVADTDAPAASQSLENASPLPAVAPGEIVAPDASEPVSPWTVVTE